MSDVFISYARSTAKQAQAAAEALKALGYSVWLDDELLAHHAYTHAIEAQLTAAKVALVIWSAEAVKSEWVLSEANRAREDHKLVQLTVDGARLPMPFDQTQCAGLAGWTGDASASGWLKVTASIAELIGATTVAAAPGPALALPSKPSIAVMPFANLSGDPEQDYFADGMTAEVTGVLSRSRSLFVIASASTLPLRGKVLAPQEIGRLLGVRYLLDGSVRKAGGRVRIAVSLIEAASGTQMWTERFEDTLDDVFALQDRVAVGAASAIDETIFRAELLRAARRPTDNMGSYDLYLRAQSLASSWDPDRQAEALRLLERANALDPEFTRAHTLAGFCHAALAASGPREDLAHHRREARRSVQRALQLSPNDPEVLSIAADVLGQLDGDPTMLKGMVDHALELDPGLAAAWFVSGWLRVRLGELDIGIEHIERARRLAPLTSLRPFHLAWLGLAAYAQGRDHDAVAYLTESHQLAPRYPITLPVLAACYGQLGDARSAQRTIAELRGTGGLSHPWATRMLLNPQQARRLREGIALAESLAPSHNADV